MKDVEPLNELWPRLLIKEFIHHGIRTFCIAPGSRSTPLTLATANHPLAETIVHYDERGLAFHALGHAKGSGNVVALIVTSGSALGNLLPAIMEAYHDHIPLILLTADRPPELRDTGANQTTDQVKIFQNFVHWACDLPCPDSKISQDFIGTTVAQGLSHALSEPKGPVHFNCMFRKPLHPEGDSLFASTSNRLIHRAKTTLSIGKPKLEEHTLEQMGEELSQYEQGILLVSGSEIVRDRETILTLAHHLKWPIFPDILSPIRNHSCEPEVISYYDLIIKGIGANEDFSPDAILQLGDRFVSDKLLDWIAIKKPKVYCHCASHVQRKDPIHSITHRIVTDLEDFVQRLPHYLPEKAASQWLNRWTELNELASNGVTSYFKTNASLSEPYLFHTLMQQAKSSTLFFFSNSMCIRNGETFFAPKKVETTVYGNRGLSGIDGNIATIAGLAKGSGKPVIACIGDLAFLHDVNSLFLIKDLPVTLIVMNNNGGDIFSFLPINQQKNLFETYFRTPHHLSFQHAADLFGIAYTNPQTMQDLESLLASSKAQIIEVKTKPNENKRIHQEILITIREILSLHPGVPLVERDLKRAREVKREADS